MPDQSFADRLKELIGSGSANRFAQDVDIGGSLLRKYLSGATPGIDKVARIAEVTGARVEWLVTGRGPMRYDENDGQAAQGSAQLPAAKLEMPGFTLVPRLDVRASAGSGLVSYTEEALDYLAFQEGWLRARKINPATARVITAKGDSMEDTIRDGDTLLVDTSIDRFRDNAIYVVIYGEMTLVKRVHGRANGSLQLISDNPRYPAEEITAGEAELLNVAGRVMWFGRTI